MLQPVSRHVIENQEIGFKKFGTDLRRVVSLHQILPGNVLNYMLGTTTKLSMPVFQVLGFWLHLKEVLFLGLGLTVTTINSKRKYRNKIRTNLECKKM